MISLEMCRDGMDDDAGGCVCFKAVYKSRDFEEDMRYDDDDDDDVEADQRVSITKRCTAWKGSQNPLYL